MRYSRRKGPAIRHGFEHHGHRRAQRNYPLATKILGLYLGQNTMVPSIRIFREERLNMAPFFTKVISLDDGPTAFEDLGLDMNTLGRIPKKAMKIVMRP